MKSETAARLQIDRGVADARLGALEAAEADFDSASELCKLPGNAAWLSELKRREALVAILRNRPEEAEELTRQALSDARRNRQPAMEANAMAFLGAILTNTRHWGEATEWLQPANTLARKLSMKTLIEANSGNLGWCYYNLGDLDSALVDSMEADRVAAEIGLTDDRRRWLTNIGLIYEDRDDFSAAAAYHSRALALARQADEPGPIATCLHNLAIDAFNRSDFPAAEKYNREELRLKRQSGNRGAELYGRYLEGHIQGSRQHYDEATAIFGEIEKEAGTDLSLRWQSQVSLAQVNVARNRPDLAQKDYEAALQTIGLGRRNAGRDELKLSFRAGRNRYYSDYIQFLMQQGRPLEALNVAETSRSQVLAERLGVEAGAGFTVAHVQAIAGALQSVFLSYWLTPEGSYLWVVTPKEFAAFTLPPSSEIAQLAEAYRGSVASSADPSDTRLYEALVAPAQKYISSGGRVVVIPDGSLFQINFETLLVPGSPRPHYWIEDAVISTATSLALMSPRPRTGGRGNVLLIGNPVSPNSEFPALPFAGVEMQSIAERFPAVQRTVYEGAKANVSAYLTADPGIYSWIHFAAHGVASKESPLDSAIVLSNQGDSYKLYARDITKLPLKADLVTISACYGSGAKTYAGEGIVGLAWAFLLAGAHNVVASLWEANDRYTAQLMDRMYERLMAGEDAAHALRTAKLSLLRSEYICRNPRYWGAFQLYTGY